MNPSMNVVYLGPEGYSFLCLNGHFNYTAPVDGLVQCPECQLMAPTIPNMRVICASPDHNEAKGCTNPFCWKYVSRSEVRFVSPEYAAQTGMKVGETIEIAGPKYFRDETDGIPVTEEQIARDRYAFALTRKDEEV